MFSYKVQGNEFKDFDIWEKTGGANRAYVENGARGSDQRRIPHCTSRRQVENPEINAIEIIPQTAAGPRCPHPRDGPRGRPRDAATPVLQIDAGKVTGTVSPMLYGLMTEEINFSYEGGLYARIDSQSHVQGQRAESGFLECRRRHDHRAGHEPTSQRRVEREFEIGHEQGVEGFACRDRQRRLLGNSRPPEHDVSRLVLCAGGTFFRSADGFPRKHERRKSFRQRRRSQDLRQMEKIRGDADHGKRGSLQGQSFRHFNEAARRTKARFGSRMSRSFRQLINTRPNGTRPDIMQLLADMQPKFLRFPGGNYLEGNTIAERFNWKETIGDVSQRPGHRSPWGYWSTDGFGLLEFLEWCEDLNMEPVLAVYAGYSLRGERVEPGPNLEPYVQEALDEIEYVIGDANTKWGAQRVKDGHPRPFQLTYVEIGNEDLFDRSGSYDGRFAQFYDAIKAKYPKLQVISTVGYEQPESQRVHSACRIWWTNIITVRRKTCRRTRSTTTSIRARIKRRFFVANGPRGSVRPRPTWPGRSATRRG